MPADLVATDRDDIEVTRWFDVGFSADPHSGWRLKGGRLDLEAGCEGSANCDTRFRIEVQKSVTVLRGGRATRLTGSGK
ncbi:hypothetical protein ABZ686_12860 [Streptomyces sp. NPDC006992]|uniref:hypothetical protein n=1 Tax=unclassified Streptomyces TaxID=2593676 RepID=UPI0033E7A68F